jgi:hypothetical protein
VVRETAMKYMALQMLKDQIIFLALEFIEDEGVMDLNLLTHERRIPGAINATKEGLLSP